MAIDRRLLDILCCPTSKVALEMLSKSDLDKLNRQIAQGGVQYVDGDLVAERASAALVSRDRRSIYLIEDDIPVLLPERAIAVLAIPDL